MLIDQDKGGSRRDLAIVITLGLAVALSYLSPLFGGDGVVETEPFVDAVRESAPKLDGISQLVVHPPWRDDVTDALVAANVLPGVRVSEAFAPQHGAQWGKVAFIIDRGAPGLPAEVRRRRDDHGKTIFNNNGLEIVVIDDSGAPVASFAGRLSLAQVSVESKLGKITRCKWKAGKQRHECPGLPGWMHVGEENVVTSGKSEKCIWAHPTSGGKVSVRFQNVTVGERLELSHALADSAMSNKRGAPVTASVFVGKAMVGRVAKQNRKGFDAKAFVVPDGQRGAGKNVRVEITTRDDGARHYCFRLRSLEGAK